MSAKEKLVDELKSIGSAMLYFGCWITMMVCIKMLVLAEYDISFTDFSKVLVGALILSKVVRILELVSLGQWVSRQPAWVDLVLRTTMYAVGVLVVLVLENAFEARDEYGGFIAAVASIPGQADMRFVWANTVGLTGALLTFNFFNLLRGHLAGGSISSILRQPPPSIQGEN